MGASGGSYSSSRTYDGIGILKPSGSSTLNPKPYTNQERNSLEGREGSDLGLGFRLRALGLGLGCRALGLGLG